MTEKDHISDLQLDTMLRRASQPDLPRGFEDRMLKRLSAEANSAEVIQFPGRAAPARANPWLIGVPLAASLLIGISLGTLGIGTDFIAADDVTSVSIGLEEAEQAAEEENT